MPDPNPCFLFFSLKRQLLYSFIKHCYTFLCENKKIGQKNILRLTIQFYCQSGFENIVYIFLLFLVFVLGTFKFQMILSFNKFPGWNMSNKLKKKMLIEG